MRIGTGSEDQGPVALEIGVPPAPVVVHVAPVVVEPAVAVPERAHHPAGFVVIAVDEAAAHARVIVHLHVGDDFLDEDVFGHGLHVQFLLQGFPVAVPDGALQEGEFLLDTVPVGLGGIFGVLHGRGHPVDIGIEVVRGAGPVVRSVVDVQGQQDSLLRVQFHPVTALFHLFGDHIQAQVLPVQGDGGVPGVIGIGKSQSMSQIESHEIHHVGDVPVVGQQHPVPVRSHPEEGRRCIQLDAVRLLGIPVPGGVAPAADPTPRLLGVGFLPGHLDGARAVILRFFGIDLDTVIRHDVDMGDDIRGKGHFGRGHGPRLLLDPVLSAGDGGRQEENADRNLQSLRHFVWNLYTAKVRPPSRSL